jgi:glycosyltransferase involved in cell wall biosynthesis
MCYNYLHTVFDGIILYSSAETRLIKERNRKKVFVANNTVNFADYPVINESKSKIKEQLGIPFRKVVLFVGRMGIHKERKKPGHLIEIFRNCQRDDTGLVIVGSGLSDELQERMNPENTMYLGEIHDPDQVQISRIFKMADLCSIPGHVGLGINQAFFWGLPIVTENGGQPPEISYLKNGQNGYIVPENDINQLQEKIFYLLNNDDVRSRFSQCARQYILENASVEKMFEGFFNCVNYLTENKQ